MTQRLIGKERQKESHDIGEELVIGLAMTLTIPVDGWDDHFETIEYSQKIPQN
ncbi:hypothetical protein ABID29_001465 [Streptococcus rupicaprae]|uniref:Uncharacterized protein n=1 Tax=Streptococcus rupicaprae TaxID=759619 RepID=A0ABV2FIK7_9STRE